MREVKLTECFTPQNIEAQKRYVKILDQIDFDPNLDELELGFKAKEGDIEAKHKLIINNLRFAFSVAKRYMSSKVPLEDLAQSAVLGLCRAVETYDPTRGFKFTSYAVAWIQNFIQNSLKESKSQICIPDNVAKHGYRIQAFIQKYMHEFETVPSAEIISSDMDLSYDIVTQISYHLQHTGYSLQDLIVPDGETRDTLLVDETVEDEFENTHKKELVKAALSFLDEREQKIIKLYFGIDTYPHTLTMIADALNLTDERCNQIRKKAILKLQKHKHLLKRY